MKYLHREIGLSVIGFMSVDDAAHICRLSDFMVDSGSDVVTVRREILSGLDLEFIRTIKSHGVHATREKQLYRCLLKVGESVVEAEVSLHNDAWTLGSPVC